MPFRHCFKRSAFSADTAISCVTLASSAPTSSSHVTPEYIPRPLFVLVFELYHCQRTLFITTSVWVLAHGCSPQAFSGPSPQHDITGWVLHSLPRPLLQLAVLTVPTTRPLYRRDTIFLPKTREVFAKRSGADHAKLHEIAGDAPLYTLMMVIGQQLFGWPNLFTNVTGHDHHERQREGRGGEAYCRWWRQPFRSCQSLTLSRPEFILAQRLSGARET